MNNQTSPQVMPVAAPVCDADGYIHSPCGLKYKVKDTHVSDIRVNDTVVIDGELKTVGKKDLSRCSFMGDSLCGDNHNSGRRPVKLAVIFNPLLHR